MVMFIRPLLTQAILGCGYEIIDYGDQDNFVSGDEICIWRKEIVSTRRLMDIGSDVV